jgi:hypothetical protein
MNNEPTFQLEKITVDLAHAYLGDNTHNRNVRSGKVMAYATDMKTGRWVQNGDPIRFDINGTLIDGQHRLLAVIESGVPVEMFVVRGLSPKSQDTIDSGIPRKFADALKLRGFTEPALLGAATRSYYLWSIGVRRFGGTGAGVATSTPALLNCLENNPWLQAEVPLFRKLSAQAHLPSSITGALVYAFMTIDADDAEYFWERVCSDENHRQGDAIFTLRRTLLTSKDMRGSRNVTYLAAITVKAWNKYRAGETCHLLRFSPGGASPEKFPEPQ